MVHTIIVLHIFLALDKLCIMFNILHNCKDIFASYKHAAVNMCMQAHKNYKSSWHHGIVETFKTTLHGVHACMREYGTSVLSLKVQHSYYLTALY